MIVYGTKGTLLATTTIFEECVGCKTKNSVQMFIYQQHAHIFWIPTFPIGKTGATQCSQCQLIFKKKAFSPSLLGHYHALKSNQKTPLWTFTGLGIIAILIIIAIIAGKRNDEKNAKIILTPQKGDLYEIEISQKAYTLYKVDRISADTVFLLPNLYETNQMAGLSELKEKGDQSFSTEAFPIMKAELKSMLERGEIRDIDRK